MGRASRPVRTSVQTLFTVCMLYLSFTSNGFRGPAAAPVFLPTGPGRCSAPCGGGCRGRVRPVAQDTVADALVVALHAPLSEQGLTLLGVKHLFGPVNPARGQPHRLSCVHQVAHDAAAVIYPVGVIPGRQHHQHGGRTVEGVGLRGAQHCGIHLPQLLHHSGILHCHDDRGLLAPGRGSIGARLQYCVQLLVGDLLRPVAAAAPALLQNLQHFVHCQITCLSYERSVVFYRKIR